MRRLLPAILIYLAVGPIAAPHRSLAVIDTTVQSIAVHALRYPAGRQGMLRFVRGWRLTSPNRIFGGFSALALIGPDRFQLVGDNGYWARLTLGADGGATDTRIALLPTPSGKARRKSQSDVESMVFDPQSGRSWVALEGINQVWRLDARLTRIESRARLPKPAWPANSGPEAMTRLADGRTLIFSENANDDPRGREALLFAGDPARPGTKALRFYYDAGGKGLVSDAATLPDGRVLLVHRRLGIAPVFTTILAIADPADIAAGAVVRSQAIGRVPKPLADNFEGAAIARKDGRTFLWLVSDNNFNVWQRSLLLEFELSGLPPRKPDSKKAAR